MSPAKAPLQLPPWLSQMGGMLSASQRSGVITVAVIGIFAFISVQGIFTPWQNQRRTLTQQYALEVEKSNLLSTIQSELGQLKKQEEKILLQQGIPTLTSEATRLASETGLEIESVAPQPEMAFGPYTRSQIQITASGDFTSLLGFLNLIEKQTPLLKVDTLTVSTASFLETPATSPSHRRREGKPTRSVAEPTRQKVTLIISAYSRPLGEGS